MRDERESRRYLRAVDTSKIFALFGVGDGDLVAAGITDIARKSTLIRKIKIQRERREKDVTGNRTRSEKEERHILRTNYNRELEQEKPGRGE